MNSDVTVVTKKQTTQPVIFLNKRKWLNKIVFYTTISLGALIMIIPFLWMLSTSIKDQGATMTLPPQFIPETITFTNYAQVAESFPIWKFLFNSFFVAVTSTLGQLLLCSMAAYAFSRLHFKGRDTLFLIYLATLMVPMQVTMTPQFILMKYLGWLDTYQGLILPGLFNAFGTFLLRQFFLGIPKSLEEAAFIDGASHFRVFFQIILPLSKPALATLAIFSFMQSWNNFLWPLIIVSNQDLMTVPLGLSILQGRWATDWNLLMAGVVISVIPILAVYLFAQKYFIKGITLSGIK
ncbi:carbohydrate ABC transporter permease [Fictibacillus nanhaiensis]|uniref:carbohydrate ABC transporter permease n=1 Tax=Fictibacillus nanhaiensis TaxID=742169 RepID=UPI00203BA098|nr:carbohydrate ABC transporter permease [Fictibacillus nanhaiensis]MCM3731146.1 carbohydrate ABC transporter permease [Fictibacillus nanhaiensis]